MRKLAVVVLAVCVITFWPTLEAGFLADDFVLVESVNRGYTWLLRWPTELPGNIFRPLFLLGLKAQDLAFGSRPAGFHLVSLLLHSANVWLTILVSRQLGLEWRAAVAAGLLFAVSATRVEAVAWIAAQSDLWMTGSLLLAMVMFRHWLDGGRGATLVVAIGATSAAVLSKEPGALVVLGLAIVAVTAHFQRTQRRSTVEVRWAWLALACVVSAAVLLRYFTLSVVVGEYRGASTEAISVFNFHHLLFRSLVPGPLIPEAWLGAGITTAVIGAIVVVTLLFVRGAIWRQLAVVGFLLVSTLLPSLAFSLAPGGHEGDRLLYLPGVWSALFMASVLGAVIRSRPIFTAVVAALVLASGTAAHRRAQDWREVGTLVESMRTSLVKQVPDLAYDDQSEVIRFLILNWPDTYRDVFVFRTGFDAALRRWLPRPGGYRSAAVQSVTLEQPYAPNAVTLEPPCRIRVEFGSNLYPRRGFRTSEVIMRTATGDERVFTMIATHEQTAALVFSMGNLLVVPVDSAQCGLMTNARQIVEEESSAGPPEVSARLENDEWIALSPTASGVRRVRMKRHQRLDVRTLAAVTSAHVVTSAGNKRPAGELEWKGRETMWRPGTAAPGEYVMHVQTASGRTSVTVEFDQPIDRGNSAPPLIFHVDDAVQIDNSAVITGWVFDPHAAVGTGVTNVHVWGRELDRGQETPLRFLGEATMGLLRSEVTRELADAPANTGFETRLNTAGGRWEIQLHVRLARTNRFEDARSLIVGGR